MTRRMVRKGGAGLGLLMLAAVSLLAVVPAALAVQSDQYDPFTACPTDNPALNDPAAEFAICVAGAGLAELKIADRTVNLQRLGVQVGATRLGSGDPECPQAGACFGQVPGTTVVEDDPSPFWVGPPGNPKSNPGKGRALQLKITVERAGDLSALSPGFLFGVPLAVFKLPVKFHVEGAGLDDGCYVGSEQKPDVVGPFVVGPPADFQFAADPNGFPVETIRFIDMPLQDKALAIPRAHGCGHGGANSAANANARVDEALGLPSAAGLNEFLLSHVDLAFVGAGYDGAAPDGGAAIQAAFEAAR